MGQLRIYNVLDSKRLMSHATSRDEFFLPDFLKGESPSVDFTLMTRNESGDSKIPWILISPGSYSLKMGLFRTSNDVELAFQDTFTDVSETASKTGVLVYDSAAVTNSLGGSTKIDCTFEIEVTDSGGNVSKSYQHAAILRKTFITPATITIPAEEVGATQAWVKSIAMPKDGSDPANPCDGFIMLSRPGGIPILVWFDDSGQIHHEPQL